jgi:N utilization substance protein B
VSGARPGGAAARAAMARRRAARLAAVQALYQLELGGGDPALVAEEFLGHRPDGAPASPEPVELDAAWFRAVLGGAWAARGRLDDELATALAEGWTLARCSAVVRAILRAGAFELAERTEVPVKAVLNEYVEIARLFSGGGEPGLVHAVLDRLSGRLRPAGGEA